MPHIKKLVLNGFKSFPKATEILLDRSMNVVVGPNGSGKSNLTDAICFVLGRLSMKSMRAAKAANMIFAGTKTARPSNEASVSIVFDNSDKGFALPENEVTIKRAVRRNGQSIYKINNSVKTRQEILELLAQAGIDPHGFNIVLQGEIAGFVKMQGEERRKIVEEVAGISVYEIRKQKSLRELDKTEDRLKEVSAVLRERTSYLKNLENERQQALKFKKLEETVKRCKGSILKRKLDEKGRGKKAIQDEMHKKATALDKVKIIVGKTQEEIRNLNTRIEEINLKIQESSGVEQETLGSEIAELKAEVAGLDVRKENYQSQIEGIEKRSQELTKNIEDSEQEIQEMRKTKGKSRKQDLDKKKQALEQIEEKRKKLLSQKSSQILIQQRTEDKKKQLARLEQEAGFIFNKIQEIETSLHYKDSLKNNKSAVTTLKTQLEQGKEKRDNNDKKILETEKLTAASQRQVQELEKIKKQVKGIGTCPMCKTKISHGHKDHIEKEANEKITILQEEIKQAENKKNKSWEAKETLLVQIKNITDELEGRQQDVLKLEMINEKKQQLRNLEQNKTTIKEEADKLGQEKSRVEKNISQSSTIEEEYDSLKLEVDELARHEEVDVGMEITLKQRELDRMKLIIKQSEREKEELEQDISELISGLEEKQLAAEEKEKQEQALQSKFKKMIEEKNKIQDKVRLFETDLLKKQNDSRLVEDEINNFKIKIAEVNAQIEGVSEEYKEFESFEILKLPMVQLQEKLEKTQHTLSIIGSVNLRALEVYEDIKKEYDAIAEKVTQLGNEKIEILKIVQEIDNKKKKTFNKTLSEINNLFSQNFTQLSSKGQAFLEPENKQDVFSGGLDIIIKVGKGKYFDVTSLSGGEQTLIALSLIFAIQEYRPYSFYIFDEIDAALDKRNSERLALLLKKHMKAGQYLMITHNDALISESTMLYGVSMQEGISKVLSLEI
jgi:chromosome segregation protein